MAKVIRERRLFSDGRSITKFELITDTQPTREEVTQSQIRCGYHPAGYSGPWDVKTNVHAEGYITTFSCAGTCD